jgi:ubiquinone/menaquinone biosynthesis C-methylase UbiE
MNDIDFSGITERSGVMASKEQLSILLTRYDLARSYSINKEVLEIACGSGVGLSYLGKVATRLCAGDIDSSNVELARVSVEGLDNIEVDIIDAHKLDFPNASFDTVILFEAIYYLSDIDAFMSEVKRVLKPGGNLVISSVNCEWPGSNPSPYSTKYYTAKEMYEILRLFSFDIKILAGFWDDLNSPTKKIIRIIRKIAIKLHLIPKTMKGKKLLKKLFLGDLTAIPKEISGDMSVKELLVEIDASEPQTNYKMLYFIATKL